ncbi:MAG TPA: ABC transporter ATP-binding protein [Bryobacteraceae bacterium]|nr:ABC transporter ATP-binding protein [Bryobacteraceae bacterium]
MDTPVLDLRGISKQFPGHLAVENLSLSLRPGEFFSLLGPSGCGKTTTLRMVAGFEQPTAGEIHLKGERIDQRRPYQRNVSTVFQNYALFPHLTVQQNVEFGLRRHGVRNDLSKRVRDVLELVQLGGKESRLPAQISGGERQRVALARSLVLAPDVLLLDEPLSALDPNLRKQVRAELKSLQRSVGITFLFVTHDQEEALSLSDRMALLSGGRLEQLGSPEELYLRPRTRFVAAFLGSVNWIDGVGVRPEAVRLSTQAPDAAARSRNVAVEQVQFLGNSIQVRARMESGEVIVAEVSRLQPACSPGDRLYAWWLPDEELRLE